MNTSIIVIGMLSVVVVLLFCFLVVMTDTYKAAINEYKKTIDTQKLFIDTELKKLKKDFVPTNDVIAELELIITDASDCLNKNHFHDARVILSPAAKKISEQVK